MKIGIALPVGVPGVTGERILQWAREAEANAFSSLSVLDRVAYSNYEPLIALAAAAAVTRRVRLVTAVLLAPVRNTGILAKSAATLDALSNGRLTLGLGIGLKKDDFVTAPADFATRGKRFDEQLATLKRIWAGERIAGEYYPVGPMPVRPGGPELLLGGRTPKSISRVGRWADGYLSPGVSAKVAKEFLGYVDESWKAHGRSGRPRIVGVAYCALGPGAEERCAANIRHYYAFEADGGAGHTTHLVGTPKALKSFVGDMAGLGMDEVIVLPWLDDLEQVKRIADAVC